MTNSNASKPAHFPRNATLRPRGEWLRSDEIERLAKAASSQGRHEYRDEWIIRTCFYHGLRVSELVTLRRDHINFKDGTLYVRRLKGSRPSTHPMNSNETRAFKILMKRYPNCAYLFVSDLGGPMIRQCVNRIIERAGKVARLGPVHPHQLRHSCGYDLANRGFDIRKIQDWLGHRDIHMTVRYTELAVGSLRDLVFE